jgi:hypothetical protein
MMQAAEEQLEKEFLGGHDPGGRPWAEPLAGNRPLIRTGALRSSFVVEQRGDGFIVRSRGVRYAIFNQGKRRSKDGTKLNGTARPMLPGRRKIGRLWSAAFKRAAKNAIKEIARKAK